MENTRRRSNRKRSDNENKQLKRENARIRKQLQQLGSAIDSNTDEFSDSNLDRNTDGEQPPKQKDPCPNCGKNLGEVEFGNFKYLFCSGCNYRKRTK